MANSPTDWRRLHLRDVAAQLGPSLSAEEIEDVANAMLARGQQRAQELAAQRTQAPAAVAGPEYYLP